jgi:phosphatidylserine/phosphatidylglycerophosphate/cardiolipin synthase-like enzyme
VLAGFLFAADGNALQFDTGARTDLSAGADGVTYLRDAHEHDAFLLDVLATARREVRIMTPWIRPDRIRTPVIWNALRDAIARGVAVHVYTDEEFNVAAPSRDAAARNRDALHALLDALGRDGLHAATVHKVHSKIVTADQSVYCVGSFNWFSASRDDAFARHETSLVYRGSALRSEIEAIRDSLERRVKRRYPAAIPA